jgi:MoaA/NifB/PqqE/SkfB family radical SAM enzyme
MKPTTNRVKRGARIFYGFIQSGLNNRQGVIGPLHKLAISVTGRCNSRCVTCNIWRLKPVREAEICLEELETLVQSKLYRNARIVIITGGEPFLRNDLDDVIDILSKNTSGMLSIMSNGLIADRIVSTVKRAAQKGTRIDKIALSLNGKRDTHDLTRGINGSFDRVMETVERLKSLGIYTSFLFTITKENFDQILWAQNLACRLGVDINFYPEVDSYRFGESEDGRGFTQFQVSEILRQLKEIYSKRRYYYFDDTSFLFTKKALYGEPITPCYGGLQSAFVNWDGEVYACEGFNDPRFSFGNIKKASFDDIFVSERAAKMRAFIKAGKCQPCFLGCEVLSSLRKEVVPMVGYTMRNRFLKRGKG